MTIIAARGVPGSLRYVDMTEALDALWVDIQERHPEVPDAVVTIGRGGCTTDWSALRPVLRISPEEVSAGAHEILAAVLHQAAHGLLATRGGHSDGNEGRYHNTGYLAAAEELGLSHEGRKLVPGQGFTRTYLARNTAADYPEAVTLLHTARRTWRPPVQVMGRQNRVRALCSCDPPRSVRVAPGVLGLGGITCEICGGAFAQARA